MDGFHGLVHDFLSRHGLEKTLKTFRKEVRRGELDLVKGARQVGAKLEEVVQQHHLHQEYLEQEEVEEDNPIQLEVEVQEVQE